MSMPAPPEGHLRRTIVPLLLMIVCPPTAIVLWMVCAHFDGSVAAFVNGIDLETFLRLTPRPTWPAARMLIVFALLEWMLLVLLPGKIHYGPVTPTGKRPRYRMNGVAAWVLTHGILFGASALGLMRLGEIYDNLGSIIVICNVLALVLCAALYWKGTHYPSSTDNGRSGNVVWDTFWGVELHPTIFGESMKQYVNCRLSMMGWSVIAVGCAAKQYELGGGHVTNTMLITAALQVIYLLKFFWWESGYFGSLDIMHDRFGFYIFWGVACWVPALYTIVSQYQVAHPVDLPLPMAIGLFAAGIGCIWMNYAADAQRQRVRETGGKTTVWGKPPETMTAKYVTSDGEPRESILLLSGYWGIARHFHYVPEIGLALSWTVAAGFTHVIPYAYVIFLTILLVDRAGRDDRRCRAKYGADWARYCERVRYRIIPFIY